MSSTDLSVFTQLKADITALVAPTKEIKVIDFASAATAVDAAKAVIALKKQVEAKRKELVGPLNERVKAINAYAKDIADPLDQSEVYLRSQINTFEAEQEKIREAERRRLEQERVKREQEEAEKAAALLAEAESKVEDATDAADIFGAETPAEVVAEKETLEAQLEIDRKVREAEHQAKLFDVNQQKVKNSSKIWKCELIDINLVPKEFLVRTLNNQAVLAAARGGVTEIPGVRIYQEMSTRIGANTYVPKAALEG